MSAPFQWTTCPAHVPGGRGCRSIPKALRHPKTCSTANQCQRTAPKSQPMHPFLFQPKRRTPHRSMVHELQEQRQGGVVVGHESAMATPFQNPSGIRSSTACRKWCGGALPSMNFSLSPCLGVSFLAPAGGIHDPCGASVPGCHLEFLTHPAAPCSASPRGLEGALMTSDRSKPRHKWSGRSSNAP